MSFFTPVDVGQPEEQQQAQQFQPTWDESSTREMIKSYKKNPDWVDPYTQESIRQHSSYYNIPFYEGEFDLLDAFKQAGAGFFEGFTTFNLMEPADNEYEQIFRNLGHLSGFAPGLLATPLGLAAKATQLTSLKSLTNTARMLNDKSIPMFGAKILTKKAKDVVRPALAKVTSARAEATGDALEFLTGSKARHIAEGAFHLGAASAISSWQGGIDEMMHSALGGAMAGGVFRSIGQLNFADTKEMNKVVRGIAGSLFMGLPSTLRGATTPEQVYEYTMGAYFGKGERPAHKMRGQKFMNRVMQDAEKDPKFKTSYDPELHKGWESLDPMEKDYVKRKMKETVGPLEAMRKLNEVLTKEGIDPEKLKEIPAEIEGFEVTREEEEGVPRYVIKKKVLDKYKTIMYSGGAEGADQFFAKHLAKKDKTAIIHYTFGAHEWKIADAKGFKEVLKPKDLNLANKMVEKAARELKKETPTGDYKLNLLRRNWYQIKHSEAVYAVGKVEDGSGKESYKGAKDALDPSLRNKAVRGGTGWAIEMAKAQKIRKDMPIYVYDQYVKSWYKYNHKSGFFDTIKGMPPKPPRQFAGIGTRALNKAGEAAIEQLITKGFKETGKQTKQEIKDIAEAKAKGSAKYRYEIDIIDDKITELEASKREAYEEWNKLIHNREDTDTHRAAEAEAGRQHRILEKELDDAITRRDDILTAGETGMINIETGKVVSVRKLADIDTDAAGARGSISKTAYDFVEENLKELWDTPGLPWEQKRINLKNYALRLEEEIEAHRTFTEENKSEGVVKWALDALKANQVEGPIGQEARGVIRQLMARSNLEAQITIFGADINGLKNITGARTNVPITLGGNIRNQKEPIKFIEHVFNELTGKINRDVVGTVDHITTIGKKGEFKDMTIERWREDIINTQKFEENKTQAQAERHADSVINAWKSKLMFQLGKQNYYYLGGRGDADRMFFVKMHPLTKQHMGPKWNSLVKTMKRIGELDNINKMHKKFLKQFVQPGGLQKHQADKMFWESATSNLLYDLSMNGFKGLDTATGFRKAFKIFFDPKNNFISDSKAFNKRSQIWFTNGFAGDKKYIKNYVFDLSTISPKDSPIYIGNAPVVYDTKTPIRKDGKDIIAAQTIYDSKGNVKQIRINPEILKQKYKEKAWTKPKIEGVDALPKNSFKTYEEFEAFVIGHEQGHAKHGKGPARGTKAYAANENKMNQIGLEAVAKYREQGGQYNYIIARDLPQDILNKMGKHPKLGKKHPDYEPRFSENIKRLSTELGEGVDGAIIVRDDVLSAINRDAGMPILETQNKSFIVSPHAKHGALLGKYMMHEAGAAMTKHMESKGLHMVIMESAAKQTGARKTGDYNVTKKGMTLEKGTEIYQLNPKDVYYNYSVKNDAKMAQNIRVAKQFLGLLLDNAKTPFEKQAIDDMIDRLLTARFEGTDLGNKAYDKFINMNNVQKRDNVNWLIKNIDQISIPRLIDGIREPHNELFAEKAYRYLINKEKEGLTEDWTAGEMTSEEYHKALADIEVSNTAYDAKIKAAKAAAGRGSFFGIFFDKTVRNYREQVIRNFVTREATKPKVANSLYARMRPYDKAMRQDLDGINPELKELDKDENLFFLDNYYKDNTIIDTGIKKVGRNGKLTLGQLWEQRNSAALEGVNVESLFNAAVLRVPLDSMSGIHKLQFGGFTGRNGHGILLHSRVMRALGGADLDGDEAAVYFGGEKKGMKAEWLDVFKANKSEFYEKVGKETYVGDNKSSLIPDIVRKNLRIPARIKTYRDLLTLDQEFTPDDKKLINSRGAMYSITERMRISNAATRGRNLLGQAAVTPKQIMALTHSLLTNAPNKRDSFDIYHKRRNFRITITPKTEEYYRDYARALGRAQVAFSSDPMDELGFKSRDFWFREMHKAHFNTYVQEKKKGKWVRAKDYELKNTKLANIDKFEAWQLKRGLYKNVKDIDSALWGFNWADNRRWHMDEIRDKTNIANSLHPEQQHSFFIQAARKVSPLDWRDTALGRANEAKVKLMYDEFAGNLKKYPELTKVLGRTSLKVLRSPDTRATLKFELYVADKLNEIAENRIDFNEVLDIRPDKSGTFGTKKGVVVDYKLLKEAYHRNGDIAVPARKKILREIAMRGEDFFLNDINDIGTFHKVTKLYDSMTAKQRKRVEGIHKFVEDIKNRSYLMSFDRKKTTEFDWARLTPEQLSVIKEIIKNPELKWFKGLLPQVYTKLKKQSSATLDRNTIDLKISKFRRNPGTGRKPLPKLDAKENKMLDYLVLGTYRRGDLDAIMDLEASISEKNMTLGVKRLLSYLKSAAAKTSSSRLGWESEAIRDNSKAEMIKPIVDTIQSTFRPPTAEEVKRLQQHAEDVKESVNAGKEKVLEDEMDIEIMHNTGFEGLNNGMEMSNIPKKMRPPLKELIGHLKTQSPHFRQNFNEVVRSLLGKEINTLTLYDYNILNNWFKDIKNGTWLQRWFDKGELTKLHQRHYWLFPRTISRELMRDDIALMEENGMFVMQSGVARMGKLMRPTNYVEITRDWITRVNDSSAKTSELIIQGLQNDLLFVNGFEDGESLRQIAVRKREKGYWEYKKNRDGGLSKEDHINAREYEVRFKDIMKHHSEKLDKKYIIEVEGKRLEKTGHEVVELINKKYTSFFKEMHEFITGKLDSKGRNIALEKYRYDWHDRGSQRSPKLDVDAFIKDLYKGWREGKDIVTDIGIDGLRAVSRQMMINMSSQHKEFQKVLKNHPPSQTGKIPYEYYFPHLFFNKKMAGEGTKKYLEQVYNMELKEFSKDPEIAEKRKKQKMRELLHKYHSLTGDWTFEDAEEWMNFDGVLKEIETSQAQAKQKIKWFSDLRKAGSMFSRTNHIPGYSIDASAPEAYARSLVNTYHRQLAQVFSRDIMQQMKSSMKKKWDKNQVDAWQNFMHLYVQDALGQPSIIPDSYLKNPDMKLRGTPYAWWADSNVEKKVNRIMGEFGIKQSDLPEGLRGVDVHQLRAWSNLEAQYEMAALLAHPKSMVTNVFGGTMHTVESTGWKTWRNARNIDWLRQNINSKWKSMDDVMQFVIKNGVLPEYLLYEAGLTKEMRQVKNKEFISEVAAKLVKDPEMKETTLREIAAKHGVKDKIVGFAAKFMTVPERHIRRDAFMAHYIQAWERWGGAIKDPEHPFLIEQAKKGVKATQFLYNAPHRPAFARTALGKVMTRFQLWSWNAVSFRNDVFRQAKIYGLKPGTEAYERYARMMQMDIFVFALANMFAYSLFETALPAPWNWMQDTADWIFGNEKERDRAFFGQWPKQLAPLQMVTPPILRLLPSSMRAMVDDDWSKVSKYYIWTMMPFGRMGRDIFGEGNLIENPIRIMEKTTGFPLLQMQKKGHELSEEYEAGERELPPTPGGSLSPFGLFEED